MNSKHVGDKSEAQVMAAFLKANLTVLKPFGDNQRYDLVVEEGGKFLKVQVKTARLRKNGSISFNTCSATTKNGEMVHVPYHGQIDYFAVYSPDFDKILIVPVEATGKREMSLSYVDRADTNLISKFEFNGRIHQSADSSLDR